MLVTAQTEDPSLRLISNIRGIRSHAAHLSQQYIVIMCGACYLRVDVGSPSAV